MNTLKGIALAAVIALAVALRAEEIEKPAPGPTICGKDDRNPTANIDLIQVSCIDYDRLKAQAPDFPWPVGRVTQVLVHVREGDAVRVTVDGVQKFADLIRDAWGRLIALVQFDGVGYKAVTVKVYRAVEE
jgi:hypothetical protein